MEGGKDCVICGDEIDVSDKSTYQKLYATGVSSLRDENISASVGDRVHKCFRKDLKRNANRNIGPTTSSKEQCLRSSFLWEYCI